MRPTILIIEPRREVAAALEEVVNTANFVAVVRPYVDRLTDVGVTPAAIIVRIAFEGIGEPPHAVLERLPLTRPPIVAIASEQKAVDVAARLKCDVILRAPGDVGRLCEALSAVVHA